MNNQATSRQEIDDCSQECSAIAKALKVHTKVGNRGYTDDEINVLMSDETRSKYYSDGDTALEGNKALEGTGAGAAIGGTLGAIIGGIAAIGTNVLIPGLGLVVWGPIAAGLRRRGAGGLPADWSVH